MVGEKSTPKRCQDLFYDRWSHEKIFEKADLCHAGIREHFEMLHEKQVKHLGFVTSDSDTHGLRNKCHFN